MPTYIGYTMRIPDNTDEFILWLFSHRCVGLDQPCHKWATEINHIEPRWKGDDSWVNKVPMCSECHSEYHRRGTSDEAIQALKERRIEYLEAIGREQYIND